MWSAYCWSSAHFCRVSDSIILLFCLYSMYFHQWQLLHLWRSSMSVFSFMTSVLVDDHQYITLVNNTHVWSSSMFEQLISSTIIHSGMSVHVCMIFMLRLITGISLSQFLLVFCLDSLPSISPWISGYYKIIMLYWCINSRTLYSLCTRVTMSFLKIVASAL